MVTSKDFLAEAEFKNVGDMNKTALTKYYRHFTSESATIIL